MKTIREQWADYRAKVIPHDAPAVQVQETRRAFYAGAQAILTMQWQMSSTDISDDDGAARIESWHQECRDFAAVVGTLAEHRFL